MSQGDLNGRLRRFREEKWNRGGREADGDGATSCSVEAFQFGNIGNAEERKPFG